MKRLNLFKTLAVSIGISVITPVFSGNPDRAGEAGASELLINPWALSSGYAGANSANVVGLEAMHLNVAGMAFTPKTELMFVHKRYLVGSDININSFGFTQKTGESGVIGLSVMSLNFGEVDITTVNKPEGGVGTFSPSYMNIGVSYAKEFSNSIYGGITVKIISESISNVKAQGTAFDAGIRYVTGENDQVKFGIALRNVGPAMKYSGDGLAFINTDDNGVTSTQEHRSSNFELPSLLNIGFSYDFYVAPQVDSTGETIQSKHRITPAFTFTSNSFTKDQYRIGVEYSLKEMFMLRGGYVLEDGTWFDSTKRTSAFTGPTAGLSFQAPLNKKGSTFRIDYAYEFTNPFNGTHSIGARINL